MWRIDGLLIFWFFSNFVAVISHDFFIFLIDIFEVQKSLIV